MFPSILVSHGCLARAKFDELSLRKQKAVEPLNYGTPKNKCLQVPNVFEGDITAEEEVLDWLIEMKVREK